MSHEISNVLNKLAILAFKELHNIGFAASLPMSIKEYKNYGHKLQFMSTLQIDLKHGANGSPQNKSSLPTHFCVAWKPRVAFTWLNN